MLQMIAHLKEPTPSMLQAPQDTMVMFTTAQHQAANTHEWQFINKYPYVIQLLALSTLPDLRHISCMRFLTSDVTELLANFNQINFIKNIIQNMQDF